LEFFPHAAWPSPEVEWQLEPPLELGV
jgi:hypothetical protein